MYYCGQGIYRFVLPENSHYIQHITRWIQYPLCRNIMQELCDPEQRMRVPQKKHTYSLERLTHFHRIFFDLYTCRFNCILSKKKWEWQPLFKQAHCKYFLVCLKLKNYFLLFNILIYNFNFWNYYQNMLTNVVLPCSILFLCKWKWDILNA